MARQSLEIDNRSSVALLELGHLKINRRDFKAAETYLRKSCEIEESAPGYSVIGVALRNNGKELEAEEAYGKAIRLDPKYEEAYFNLGVVLKFDRPSEAQALFRKAIELDLDYAPAHRELGFVLEDESHIRKAVELDPRDSWARIYLGTCLWQCADIDAAVAEFRTASELEPKWAFSLVSLGNIYERELKDLDSAQSFYERARLHIKRNDRLHADNI